MRLDVHTLGTFNALAHDGAETAAASLSQLSDTTTDVEVTRTDLVPLQDVRDDLGSRGQFVGVEIGFDGGMDGTIVLVFDRDSAATLVDTIVPSSWDPDADLDRSGVTEAANIMVGGFVDAWANHFGTKVAIGPPTYVAGAGEDVLPDDVPIWDERRTVLTFTSQLRAPEDGTSGGEAPGDDAETIDFQLYMFPERESFSSIVEQTVADSEFPFSVDKLSAFNEMTRQGARRAGEKVEAFTGMAVDVDVGRTTFVPIDDVERHVSSADRVGAVTSLHAAPGGFVAILFDTDSARTVADAMLPVEAEGDGMSDQHLGAIEEIGNVMTSGFIDGWANALGRKIQHDPPDVVEDSAAGAVSSLAGQLEDQEYAFLLDSSIQAEDERIGCDLLAIPDSDQFREVISEMSVDEANAAVADPDELEPTAYEDLQ